MFSESLVSKDSKTYRINSVVAMVTITLFSKYIMVDKK